MLKMTSGLSRSISSPPPAPPNPTATSLAITCTAIMVSASHWVGLTLPGMIDEPGSFSGISSSAKPARGPRSEEHTSELQSRLHLVCRLLLEKKKKKRLTQKQLITDHNTHA